MMKIENENLNIPDISIGEAVSTLSGLYINAINNRVTLSTVPSVFLWGAFGIGKSAGINEIADKIAAATGKKVTVTDVRLLLFSPVDLRGIPTASEDKTLAVWLKPKIFQMDESSDVVNILFLDELSAAPPSVQAAAYQITLDHMVGEHKLPDNCIVIAAGNRTTDKSVAYAMPKALCNRLLHFNIRSVAGPWIEWAVNNGIDSRIVGFISFDNSRLNIPPETSDMAFPTPRSWNFVSDLLKITGAKNPSDIHSLVASAIGVDTTMAFESFCTVYKELPAVEDIFKGACTIYPKTQQLLYALTASIITAVCEKADSISATELENICSYSVSFPRDFTMMFFKMLNSNEKVKIKLAKCRPFLTWVNKNHLSF